MAPSATPTSVPWPSRPRDLPIDGVDPCSLLTPAQRAEFGLRESAEPSVGYTEIYGTVTSCTVSGFEPRDIAVTIFAVTTTGIERWTQREMDSDIRRIEVHGFPALVAVPRRYTDFCTVVIDLAPGQLIDVQFGDSGEIPPIPQQELCRDAERVANYVIGNLLSR